MHKIKKLSGPVFAIIAGIFIIKISLGKKEAPKEEALNAYSSIDYPLIPLNFAPLFQGCLHSHSKILLPPIP